MVGVKLLAAVDWQGLLVPQQSLVELFIRGTVMYFALLATLRVLVRRHIGSLTLMDLLLLVLIADAAQNAMAGEYHSLTGGLVLCGTLIGWNFLLDWLAYRYDRVARSRVALRHSRAGGNPDHAAQF